MKLSTAIEVTPYIPSDTPTPLSGRILLVEDSATNALVTKAILSIEGADIDHVENGLDAIIACLSNEYDLIIMDLEMPKLNGFKASLVIRNSETSNRTTPIIAISSSFNPSTELKCKLHAMDHLVKKPIDRSSFYSTVHHFLQKGKNRY